MKLTEEEKQKVEDNIGLVYHYYNYYLKSTQNSQPFSKDEIISELFLTLCKAVKSFDPNRNIKFSTYTFTSFRNSYISYNDNYIKQNQRFIRYDNIERIFNLCHFYPKFINWDKIECICGICGTERANLTFREKNILKKHYKENLSCKTIGKELNLSKERVRQISNESIEKIKKYFKKMNYEIEDFQNIDYTQKDNNHF